MFASSSVRSVGTAGTDGAPVVLGTEGTETGSDDDAPMPGTEVTETGKDGDAPMPGTEVSETGKDGEAPPVGTELGRLIGSVEFPKIGIGSETGRFRADAEAVATTEAIVRKLMGRMLTERWLGTL